MPEACLTLPLSFICCVFIVWRVELAAVPAMVLPMLMGPVEPMFLNFPTVAFGLAILPIRLPFPVCENI